MLRMAIMFLVIALIAAAFSFNLIAGMAFEGAKILFFIFLVLAVLMVVGNVLRGGTPRDIV